MVHCAWPGRIHERIASVTAPRTVTCRQKQRCNSSFTSSSQWISRDIPNGYPVDFPKKGGLPFIRITHFTLIGTLAGFIWWNHAAFSSPHLLLQRFRLGSTASFSTHSRPRSLRCTLWWLTGTWRRAMLSQLLLTMGPWRTPHSVIQWFKIFTEHPASNLSWWFLGRPGWPCHSHCILKTGFWKSETWQKSWIPRVTIAHFWYGLKKGTNFLTSKHDYTINYTCES